MRLPHSLAPLRHRAYRAIWLGSAGSNIGTWMQAAALGYYVADLTKSAAWSALTAAAEFAPTALLGPLGGALADRVSRRMLFLAGSLVQTALAALLTVAMLLGRPGAPMIALYALANGCVFALVFPAFGAILPDLVPADDLPAAVGLNSAQWNVGRVVGPVIGAGIYAALGIAWVLAFNAVSFLLVVVAVAGLRTPVPAAPAGRLRDAIVDGWRFVRREPGLRLVVGALLLNTLCIAPFIGLIPAMVVKVFDAGKGSVGLLITAQGLGAVTTGLAFGAVSQRFGVRRVMLAAMVGLPFTVSAYALSPSVGVATIGLFFTGMLYFAALASFTTVAQMRAASEYRGRVLSVNQVVLGLGYTAALAVQGPLGDRFGVRQVTIGAAAVALLVLAAVAVAGRGVTRVLDEPPAAAARAALAAGG